MNEKWKTKGGHEILIRNMDTDHLINATNYMMRNESNIREAILQHFIKFSSSLNGEKAQEHADGIIDDNYGEESEEALAYEITDTQEFNILDYPPMVAMLDELKKRGVNHDPWYGKHSL